jgi:hypothetical protein
LQRPIAVMGVAHQQHLPARRKPDVLRHALQEGIHQRKRQFGTPIQRQQRNQRRQIEAAGGHIEALRIAARHGRRVGGTDDNLPVGDDLRRHIRRGRVGRIEDIQPD